MALVTDLLARIAGTMDRYGMVRPGQRVGVAVSGGADSVCLLHCLLLLAPRWELRLHVLHLDHNLRGEESREDAEFVRRMAAELALPVTVGRADLSAPGGEPGTGGAAGAAGLLPRGDGGGDGGPGGAGPHAIGPGGDGAVSVPARVGHARDWRESVR